MIFLPLDDPSKIYKNKTNSDLLPADHSKARFKYHNFPVQDSSLKAPVASKLNQANLLLNYINKVQLTGQQARKRGQSTLVRSSSRAGGVLALSMDSRNPELTLSPTKKQTKDGASGLTLQHKTYGAYSSLVPHSGSNRLSRNFHSSSQ